MKVVETKLLRLDQLNLPAEGIRKSYSPAGYRKLKRSIEKHGILVPIITRPLSDREYAVIDGYTRIQVARELGLPATTKIPALVVAAEDDTSVTAAFNINQYRESLSALSEIEALRMLVDDYNYHLVEAAQLLGKSRSWASGYYKIFLLPKPILEDLKKGRFSPKHAYIMAKYLNNKSILKMLHQLARSSDVSANKLSVLAKRAETAGVTQARKAAPQTVKTQQGSFYRVEPLKEGLRLELHLSQTDSLSKLLKELTAYLKKKNLI